MKTKTQYLKQKDGSIIKFDAQFVVNDDGKEIQLVGVEGTEVGKGAYKAQEAKREKEKLGAQEEAAKAFEVKQANKASGLKKFAEAMPSLTADEIKALFGG
jgi:C-terminal processing protease CtpA/Prc